MNLSAVSLEIQILGIHVYTYNGNLSNQDTIGPDKSVLNSEVSLIRGLLSTQICHSALYYEFIFDHFKIGMDIQEIYHLVKEWGKLECSKLEYEYF